MTEEERNLALDALERIAQHEKECGDDGLKLWWS